MQAYRVRRNKLVDVTVMHGKSKQIPWICWKCIICSSVQ